MPELDVDVRVGPVELAVTVEPAEVLVIAAGNVGPPGPRGQSPVVVVTQFEYDAMPAHDPEVLYVIIN